jgi:hypothetical protein
MRELGFAFAPDIWIFANIWSDENIDVFQDKVEIAKLSHTGGLHRLLEGSALCRAVRAIATARDIRRWKENLQRPHVTERVRVPLPDYEANLATALDLARRHACEMVFMVLPCESDFGMWTEGSPWTEAMGMRDASSRAPVWDEYRAAMREAARQAGKPLVDLPAAFAQYYAQHGQSLLLDPIHPNVLGNQVMAWAALQVLLASPGTWPAAFAPPPGLGVEPPDPGRPADALRIATSSSR